MRSVLLALLFVACAVAARSPYYVDELHRTLESHDVSDVVKLYESDARLHINGRDYTGTQEISEFYFRFFEPAVHHRIIITSPLYDNNQLVHFTAQTYIEGVEGCSAVIHSLEQLMFSQDGKIVSHRSEWDEKTAVIEADLACKHVTHEHPEESREHKNSDKIYEMHHALETQDAGNYTKFFAPEANMHVFGGDSLTGQSAIRKVWTELLNTTRTVAFSPTSMIYARDDTSSYISTLFVVTETGCANTYSVIAFETRNAQGLITDSQMYMAGITFQDFTEDMHHDCGEADDALDHHESSEEERDL